VETEEYLVVRYPSWWEQPLQLVRFEPQRPVDEVLDEALEQARGLTDGIVPRLDCWVRLGAPDGLEQALLARGGTLDETLDVLALDLSGFDPTSVEPSRDVELRWTDDLDVLLDAADLNVSVFGGSTPARDELESELPGEVLKHRTGGGGSVVAYREGRPVGTGGITVAGGDARLWGGAVLPEARGNGIYRAVLAARLQYGIHHGARLAIVKGRVETSAPILRRVGFTAHGRERSYLVDLA
jgi:GNAT superfamily N-acetyltransferase